jgi:adenylosuccinate synthase
MTRPTAYIVTDLGFGDAGKGTLVDALARRHGADLVVRYNGGAQAAHTVVTPDGRSHVFHQFGAASFLPGVETFLSRYVLVNPAALFLENEVLVGAGGPDALERLYVDGDALVTTMYHVIANRLREYARGGGRHGSCGQGIGETVADFLACGERALRVADLHCEATVRDKLSWLRELKRRQLEPLRRQLELSAAGEALDMVRLLNDDDEFEATIALYQEAAGCFHVTGPDFLRRRLLQGDRVIFEGAQGVLLDEDKGFHPHTTWSCTTTRNARALLARAEFDGPIQAIGVLRAYHTRHGVGPFPTEDGDLTRTLVDRHNPTNTWQGAFRVGWFDLPLAKYALRCAEGIDSLVVTCLDRIAECGEWKVAVGYREGDAILRGLPRAGTLEQQESLGQRLRQVVPQYQTTDANPETHAAWIARHLELPLSVLSYGPTAGDKVFCEGTAKNVTVTAGVS